VSDLTEDINRNDFYKSLMQMTTLEVTNSFFSAAMEKLFYEGPYISDGHEKEYGEESVFDIVKTLVDEEAAGPVFREYI
jgi:hypothetical protein